MPNTIQQYFSILSRNYGFFAIIGITLLLFHNPFLLTLGFILLFTSTDIIGFRYIDHERGTPHYRILQIIIQFLLGMVVYLQGGIQPLISSLIIWYTFGCDVLFYLELGIPLHGISYFTSSPVVFLFVKILKRDEAPKWAILLGVFLGIAIAIFILLKKNSIPEIDPKTFDFV